MKFFFSQMEVGKEAIRVGTLSLIRAVVSADGEQQRAGGVGRAVCVSGLPPLPLRVAAVGRGSPVS